MTYQTRIYRWSPIIFGDSSRNQGASARWTLNLVPVGNRPVLSGQQVELYVQVDADSNDISTEPGIRFDIFQEDYRLTGDPRDRVISLLGTGAPPADETWLMETRTTVRYTIPAEQSVEQFVEYYVRHHRESYSNELLLLNEESSEIHRLHFLTWWRALPISGQITSIFLFSVGIDNVINAESNQPLNVSTTSVDEGSVQLELQYEDRSPMGNAEYEVFFNDRHITGRTNEQGIAVLDMPLMDDETFRLFVHSFPQRSVLPGEDIDDLSPEVLKIFAYDSAFPGPVAFEQLKRVKAVALQNPDILIRVYGHTSVEGSVSYNQTLSEQRAKSVFAMLTDNLDMLDEVATQKQWGFHYYQAMLRGLGNDPGPIDGADGPMTQAATRAFQQDYNDNVFHGQGREKAYLDLDVDGVLGTDTKAALRDSYVAMAPHVTVNRYADPPWVGCSEHHPVSGEHSDNRRVVIAFLSMPLPSEAEETDTAPSHPCRLYAQHVGEIGDEPRDARFFDFHWLRAEDGAVHLSAVTSVADGTPAQFTIFHSDEPVSLPPPHSAGSELPPAISRELGQTDGRISGGVSFARWVPPQGYDPFDYENWLIDYDIELEAFDEGEETDPGADDQANSTNLFNAVGILPPLFRIDAAGRWAISDPPGQRLNRMYFIDDARTTGISVRSDGKLLNFTASEGRIRADYDAPVLSYARTKELRESERSEVELCEGVEDLLGRWLDVLRRVTFPIHRLDSGNITNQTEYYGFSIDGRHFHNNWSLNFSSDTRITACFTGLLKVRDEENGDFSLLLENYAARPEDLPEWYPYPKYAKYSPFDRDETVTIARSLLFTDAARERRFRALFCEQHPGVQIPDDRSHIINDEFIPDFISGNLGIPVRAGTILTRLDRGIHIYFHPANSSGGVDISKAFNLNFYFQQWESEIANYQSFPSAFRQNVIGPSLSTSQIHYVKRDPDSEYSPLYPGPQGLMAATSAAAPNDTILILDNETYELNLVDNFVSIIGLPSSADDDVTEHDEVSYNVETNDRALLQTLQQNYPTIRSPEGRRGIWITYSGSNPGPDGLIYLNNLSISGNRLDTQADTAISVGGAGIYVDGSCGAIEDRQIEIRGAQSVETISLRGSRIGFDQIHIHNCAICRNVMENFPAQSASPLPVSYCGGGILCYYSSPYISNCLIRSNKSFYHGGGIGIFMYGWPMIVNNVISHNTACGHPYGDLDNDTERGGNGDGGGIGVFQAYPENREPIERAMRNWRNVSDSRDLLPLAWNEENLRKAKTQWIYIWNNRIHHNTAMMSGGGVYGTVCSRLSLFDNKIDNNSAIKQDGGGLAVTYGSVLQHNGSNRTRNTILHNRAGRQGGGLYIRSSKVDMRNCSIRSNSSTGGGITVRAERICGDTYSMPSSFTLDGGGIAVVSKAEILSGNIPIYDIIQHLIWDHIDRVEFLSESIEIRANTASRGNNLFVHKDTASYLGRRTIGQRLDIIRCLPVYVRLECVHAAPTGGNVVIIGGTPDYPASNVLETNL